MSKKDNDQNSSSSKNDATPISPETGSDKKENRRKVLRNTLIGGAVISTGAATSGKWRKPALEAVILPAHAETTDDSGSDPEDNTTTTTTTTTCIPNPNANIFCTFNFSSWTEDIV